MGAHSSREGEAQMAGETPASYGCAGVRARLMETPRIAIVSSSRENEDAGQTKASLQAGMLYPSRPAFGAIAQAHHEGCEAMAHSSLKAKAVASRRCTVSAPDLSAERLG